MTEDEKIAKTILEHTDRAQEITYGLFSYINESGGAAPMAVMIALIGVLDHLKRTQNNADVLEKIIKDSFAAGAIQFGISSVVRENDNTLN